MLANEGVCLRPQQLVNQIKDMCTVPPWHYFCIANTSRIFISEVIANVTPFYDFRRSTRLAIPRFLNIYLRKGVGRKPTPLPLK